MKLYEFVCKQLEPIQAAKVAETIAVLDAAYNQRAAANAAERRAYSKYHDLTKLLDTGKEYTVWHGAFIRQGTLGALMSALDPYSEIKDEPEREALQGKLKELEALRTTLDADIAAVKSQLENAK